MKFLCPATGKQIYGTPGRALWVAANVGRQQHREYRIYRCEHCGWFHLTSRPRKMAGKC